jgi:hypothetical protein
MQEHSRGRPYHSGKHKDIYKGASLSTLFSIMPPEQHNGNLISGKPHLHFTQEQHSTTTTFYSPQHHTKIQQESSAFHFSISSKAY